MTYRTYNELVKEYNLYVKRYNEGLNDSSLECRANREKYGKLFIATGKLMRIAVYIDHLEKL